MRLPHTQSHKHWHDALSKNHCLNNSVFEYFLSSFIFNVGLHLLLLDEYEARLLTWQTGWSLCFIEQFLIKLNTLYSTLYIIGLIRYDHPEA